MLKKALEEFLGPRADNQQKKKKTEMYRQIARDGFCTLETWNQIEVLRTTLNT